MNLVQKLPAALGLACVVIMSSCSKEDVATPTPQALAKNGQATLRNGAGMVAIVNFPTTEGATGINVYPLNWSRLILNQPDNFLSYPTGTSDLNHLWGNNLLPWIKPLPKIASIPTMHSILTATTGYKIEPNSIGDRSSAMATIKHLKVGKRYAVTFYVATTSRNVSGFTPAYAKRIEVWVTSEKYGGFNTLFDMTGKEAEWVKGTIEFKAETTEHRVSFKGSVAEYGQYAFTHMYVDKDSIHEVN